MIMDASDFLDTFLEEADDLIYQWQSIFIVLESDPYVGDQWNALFRVAHTLKGSSKAVGLKEFGEYIHKVEDYITFLKTDSSRADDHAMGVLSESFEIILEWILRTRNRNSNSPEYHSNIENIKNAIEVLPNTTVPKKIIKIANRNVDNDVKSDFINNAPSTKMNQNSQYLRINIEKIDKLMQIIGEISTQASIVFHHKQSGFIDAKKCLDSIDLLSENLPKLRDITLQLRMDTLEKFFQRMQKIANDVARSQDKKIEVIIEGKDIEMDKTIVDRIVDPFVHIVRNAVDHGIETKEERMNTSKDPIAKVYLKAISNGHNVEISVSEDGRGMNHHKIINKAFEKGLIASKNIAKSEALRLIMKPGFSTAENITDISGRGVGMDVVASTLDELGGTLIIDSELGYGSSFTACLPTSVAIIDSFIVKSDDQLYVVPRMDVIEVIELRSYDKLIINDKEQILHYRKQIVPIVNLADYFSIEGKRHVPSQAFLISYDGRAIAIEVDQIAWQQEIVARNIKGSLSKMMGVSGYTILSDGEPSLILSLKEFAQDYFRELTD